MCKSIDPSTFLCVQPISFRSILMIASQVSEPLSSSSVNHPVTSSGRRTSTASVLSGVSCPFVDHRILRSSFSTYLSPIKTMMCPSFSGSGQDNLVWAMSWLGSKCDTCGIRHACYVNVKHFFLFFSLLVNRSTLFSEPDWHKGITWNPGPECSHKEEKECGDTVDCWNGERLLLPFDSERACVQVKRAAEIPPLRNSSKNLSNV